MSVVMLFFGPEPIYTRILFLLGSLLVFGFSVSYKIKQDFNNEKLYSIFGLVVYKTELNLEFPDYISIFSSSFSLNNDWSTVSALGTKERHDKVVVRFFTNNRKVTLYKTNSDNMARKKAKALSDLLGLEVYDATKP
ncbi:hypothetical protein ACWGOQ_0006810 [Aquimarina sp. M1]